MYSIRTGGKVEPSKERYLLRKDGTVDIRLAYVEKDGVRNVDATESLFTDHACLKGQLLVNRVLNRLEMLFLLSPFFVEGES